ncbi:MAG: hypothetical protein ACRC20_05250 [Segniliparus sp.]|uniref:hypothetical protein n=1 Tax=Segniliparus sp. TaxID=2804064 RepID=UPI003F3F4166
MFEPVSPVPSAVAPWSVRFAYWYIGKRSAESGAARGYREPHLSKGAEHSFLYPPMTTESLESFAD